MEEELQDFSTLLEEGGDNNTTFPLIISNVNTSTLCFVISRYSQLFLHTDLEQSLTTRMLDPEILHRIQTQLKRYCTIFKKEETTVHLNILFYKLGERNKDVEDLILYRFRQASVNKLISQYNEVRWLVFYGTFFLVISTFLMFGAGYASEFWAEDNEGTVSHSLLVLIILICTFGFQTTMWWVNWQALDFSFYVTFEKYLQGLFYKSLSEAMFAFSDLPPRYDMTI